MRRSASEIVNDLEMRVARLERQASSMDLGRDTDYSSFRLAQLEKQAGFDRQAGLSIEKLLELGIITKDQYIQAKRVEEMEGKNIPKVGDILYTINQYGGLRTEFVQVVSVSPSLKSVKIVKLKTNARGINSPAGGTVTPIPDSPVGMAVTKKIKYRGNDYTFKVDKWSGYAELWDGTPKPYEMD